MTSYDPNQATWDFLREENILPASDITLNAEHRSGDVHPELGTILSFYCGENFNDYVAFLQWLNPPSWEDEVASYGIIAIYRHDRHGISVTNHWTLQTVQEIGQGINWRHQAQ